MKRKELASNLSIYETKFSRLVNGKENPSLNILYRLENHSNGIYKSGTTLETCDKKNGIQNYSK